MGYAEHDVICSPCRHQRVMLSPCERNSQTFGQTPLAPAQRGPRLRSLRPAWLHSGRRGGTRCHAWCGQQAGCVARGAARGRAIRPQRRATRAHAGRRALRCGARPRARRNRRGDPRSRRAGKRRRGGRARQHHVIIRRTLAAAASRGIPSASFRYRNLDRGDKGAGQCRQRQRSRHRAADWKRAMAWGACRGVDVGSPRPGLRPLSGNPSAPADGSRAGNPCCTTKIRAPPGRFGWRRPNSVDHPGASAGRDWPTVRSCCRLRRRGRVSRLRANVSPLRISRMGRWCNHSARQCRSGQHIGWYSRRVARQ